MATCIDIITPALYAIGAESPINPAPPEMINQAFKRLLAWVVTMQHDGIDLGVDETALPTLPGDELGNPIETDLPLQAGFTVWVAPLFRIVPDTAVRGAADAAMNSLYAGAFKADLPEWPETMPIGAGNRRGPKGRVFFPVPAFLDTEEAEEG
jgi:hypothetical protein